ncbi:hypothetical protein AAC387_Pa11g0198 [Persea americana]
MREFMEKPLLLQKWLVGLLRRGGGACQHQSGASKCLVLPFLYNPSLPLFLPHLHFPPPLHRNPRAFTATHQRIPVADDDDGIYGYMLSFIDNFLLSVTA